MSLSEDDSVEILKVVDVSNEENEKEEGTSLLQHKHTKLPYYLTEAFQDLYQEDGLLVCARGLGLLHLIATFCRFYVDTEEGHLALVRDELEQEQDTSSRTLLKQIENKTPLVFVIGLKDHERSCLISILERWGTPTHLLPTEVTNESGQGKDRLAMYNRGGIFLITSRILIVDLLTHVASPKDIDGILVAHAENVTEQSTDAFILRIYRTQKRWDNNAESSSNALIQSVRYGFVKAFSDNPDQLMAGFAKVDKVLKSLFVRRLYLYPRFHDLVSDELNSRPPVVEELHQTLSLNMQGVQASIAAAVKTCIREIKRATTLIEWSDAELTLENCVTTNFDLKISHQLENDWHRLKPATKQLVSDLRQLRTLFHYLLQYDCISFWRLINNIKSMGASARNPSLWLLTPAADRLFRIAKKRIYTIIPSKPTAKNPNPVSRLQPILEVNPKWRLLHQVLTEIERKSKDRQGGARVLVMVKDERTLESIKSYLIDGSEKAMNKRWLRFLKHANDRSRSMAKTAGGSSHLSQENRLLLEEEGRIRNLLFGTASQGKPLGTHISQSKRKKVPKIAPDWKKKRRRINEEQSRGNVQLEDERQRRAVLDEAVEETEHYDAEILSKQYDPSPASGDVEDHSSEDEVDRLYKVSMLDDLRVTIQTYTSSEGEETYLLLNDIKPTHVVLYDAEPSFIRSLEIHSACSETMQHESLRVYFMLFEASAEEKNYLKALEREQNAFERLIQHKKSMPLPVNMLGPWTTQEMQQAGNGVAGSYSGGSLPLSTDTRTGRGKKQDTEKRDIAVDVREFRSALPSILHQGGMRLAPATLTVGDFVLSNVHCVERKSISDLFGSFASGRLFTQAESMGKHYKVSCLLIEFDPSKTFSLQNANEIGADIRTDSICTKMALLAMHFPKLRLLWSRSPYETLKLFKTLKANHEEVDVDKAVGIGSNESIDALLDMKDDNEGEVDINEAARDMLLRLPGINLHNARKIMKECDSIAELAVMPRERMKTLLGPLSGQRLFTFFNQRTV
jgi:DNA excision repair protein ERCC-4